MSSMDHNEDLLEMADNGMWEEWGEYMRATEDRIIREMLTNSAVSLSKWMDPPAEGLPEQEYIYWPYKICADPNCPQCKDRPDAPGWVTDGW